MSGQQDTRDLLIIGGGINGAGIARDACGRGLSVVVCDKGDIAGATSWSSSKLIHGGLRYLEHYDFGLVRESLLERQVMLNIAPHLTHAIRFVMPHTPELRPAWMIRTGLWLYDHLALQRSLPACQRVCLAGARRLRRTVANLIPKGIRLFRRAGRRRRADAGKRPRCS